MAYSVGGVEVFDTAAGLPGGATTAGQLCFALDTGQFYYWNGSAYVNPSAMRINTIVSSATPTINANTTDLFTITALAVAITGVTVTGTPTDGQRLSVRIKDNGTLRALAWGAQFVAGSVALLTTTATSKTHLSDFRYDSAAAKWACVFADATGY